MPIDGCPHNFEHLATMILPAHLGKLRHAMATPIPMSALILSGKSAFQKAQGIPRDFPGCYVLLEGGKPKYVGISRTIIKRLYQHCLGKDHYSASFAYRIAKKNNHHLLRRAAAMKDSSFIAAFNSAKEQIAKMDVAYIEIQNDLEIYLFEAYASIELDTCEWNTFKTH
jgi:predicted GIY-YIG superfamily endonuclease